MVCWSTVEGKLPSFNLSNIHSTHSYLKHAHWRIWDHWYANPKQPLRLPIWIDEYLP
jgi:hypothetical protein